MPKLLTGLFSRQPADPPQTCPVTGRVLRSARKRTWLAWVFTGMGFFSLLWFLLRVIPKPSRAAYPCQRVAFPLASSFVVWVLALLGTAAAWRRSRARDLQLWKACIWGSAALAAAVLVVTGLPIARTLASNPAHGPVGVGKGVFPGRVVWVHAPDSTFSGEANPDGTSWAGYSSPEHWYETNHTDLTTIEAMLSKAIQSLGGTNSDAEAWNSIFKYFNDKHGKGVVGYQPGEKIAIKINLTTCNARSGTDTVDIYGNYEKKNSYDGHWLNSVDAAPQLILTLLRHLVYTVRVNQTNLYIGDPTGLFPKYLWDQLHPEFPDVNYFDNYGGSGRMRTEFSTIPFNWSVTNAPLAGPVLQDYVPVPFAIADYIINLPVIKSHSGGGITACAKNFYGALLRCPDGFFRDAFGRNQPGIVNYSDLHKSLPWSAGQPGLGHYRAHVDLMGHPQLGGKVMLCLVDGLYGGQYWSSHPYKWNTAPFNGNWPSSLFVSQDPVAIDSVCYDFLLNEWPGLVNSPDMAGGAEDYLHEAALANDPPSGTFYDPAKTGTRLASLGVHEHWISPVTKQYSRNLDTNSPGIELVALEVVRPAPLLAITQAETKQVISWRSSLLGYNLQSTTNLTDPSGWSTQDNAPALVDWWNTITNDTAEPNRFYRLIKSR
jgi:hypothetical protein